MAEPSATTPLVSKQVCSAAPLQDMPDARTDASQKAQSNYTQTRTKVEPRIQQKPDNYEEYRRLVEEEQQSTKGRLDENTSMRSSAEGANDSSLLHRSRDEKHYKVPVINWALTPVYAYFLEHRQHAHLLDTTHQAFYSEGEVDYTLDTLKTRYEEFQRNDIMQPMFEKAMQTLKFLLSEQTLEPIYHRVVETYKHITLENVMKLLIRCKLAYASRSLLLKMFTHYQAYIEYTDVVKNIISVHHAPRV